MTSRAEAKKLLAPIGIHDLVVLLMLGALIEFGLSGFADAPALGWELFSGGRIVAAFSTEGLVASMPAGLGWLGDVLLFALLRAGSWPLLYGFLLTSFALVYFLILFRVVSKATHSCVLTSFGVAGTLYVILPHLRAGRSLLDFVLFLVFYSLILNTYSSRRGDVPSLTSVPRHLWVALPAVALIWSNVGSGFVLGMLLLLLLPLGLCVDAAWQRKGQAEGLWSWILLTLACVFASFLNPLGIGVYRAAWGSLGSFAELGADVFSALSRGSLPIVLSLSLMMVGAALGARTRESTGAFPILSVAVFAILASVFPAAALFYHVLAICVLVSIAEKIVSRAFRAKEGAEITPPSLVSRLEERERRSLRGSAVLSALLLILLVDCTVNQKLLLYAGPFGPDRERFPYAAVEVLRGTWSDEGEAVVVTPPAWSGFVAFGGQGAVRPLFGALASSKDDGYEQFRRMLHPRGGWAQYGQDHGVTHLLLPRSDPLAEWLRETGELFPLHEDERALLFDLRSMQRFSKGTFE